MSNPAIPVLSQGHHTRGISLMLLSVGCFVVNVLLIRALGQHETVNVWLVSCARFVVGIVVLATIYRREVQFPRVFQRAKLAGRGVIGGCGVAIYYITVVHLGAGRATFINNSYVAFGALLAVWILHERFRGALVVGGTGALIGLALLTNPFSSTSHAGWYDLLAVVSATGSAYVVVTIRLLHAEGERTATIFAAQCVYGLLLCAIPALFHLQAISGVAIALMLTAGLFAAAGQLAMTGSFRYLPVAEGSLLQILVPLGIAAGGMAFFHERFTPHELIGAALILGGTLFTVAWR